MMIGKGKLHLLQLRMEEVKNHKEVKMTSQTKRSLWLRVKKEMKRVLRVLNEC
jgi:hypothetical protein